VTSCHDRSSLLAEKLAALRRVATLVARGANPSQVFSAVAEEIVHCLNVESAALFRYEAGGAVLVAVCDPVPELRPGGDRLTPEFDDILTMVLRTGRAARLDTIENAAGSAAAGARQPGVYSGVAVPVVVDGRLWGGVTVGLRRSERLPADTEERISDFAELVATAITHAATRDELQASRDQLRVLATQQSALRRVATLVARDAAPSELFTAVAEEMARCLEVDCASVLHFEADAAAVVVAAYVEPGEPHLPVGERVTLEGDNVAELVLRTGRAARIDDYCSATGALAARLREMGVRCRVGAPIVVDEHVWGVAVVGSSRPEPLATDTEARIAEFADLIATAIAAATTHDELIASRVRIVAAADDARRRLERDLHDGAQQRMVSLGLQLRLAEACVPPELRSLKEQVSRVVSGLAAVSSDLREISRGIHPAILSRGGLGPALKTLARRCPVPVNLDVSVDRPMPESVEVAAYYVVAEALTNVAKYAQASEVTVCAETKGADLYLSVQDDGIGGADTSAGSGLIGLKDRVEVLGGHMQIVSPPGSGTALRATVPLTS
jgi:signal transduction histidine kinase